LCASCCGHRQSVRRVVQACAIYEAPGAFTYTQLTVAAWDGGGADEGIRTTDGEDNLTKAEGAPL